MDDGTDPFGTHRGDGDGGGGCVDWDTPTWREEMAIKYAPLIEQDTIYIPQCLVCEYEGWTD